MTIKRVNETGKGKLQATADCDVDGVSPRTGFTLDVRKTRVIVTAFCARLRAK